MLHQARDVRCLIRRRPGMLHVAGLFLAFPPRLELLALRVVQASDPHRSRRGNRRMDVEDDVAHAAHAPRRLQRPPIELVDRCENCLENCVGTFFSCALLVSVGVFRQ